MSHWNELLTMAEAVAEETLNSLPDKIRTLARQVPLSFADRPSPDLQDEDVAEDTLGLFVGESLEEAGLSDLPMPGQIFLFLANIWDFSDNDIETYKEEVRVTFLHELGHYFGWDEQDLYERDLD